MTSVLRSSVDLSSEACAANRAVQLGLLSELDEQLALAIAGGGSNYTHRHHARGRMLARERIELLLDRDSPFLELSSLAAWGTEFTVGAGIVTGIGVVSDVECVVIANDPTVRGGSVNPYTLRKNLRALEIAKCNRLPVINLVESGGADLPTQAELFIPGGRVFRNLAELSALGIPTAFAAYRRDFRGKTLLSRLLYMPVVLPGLVNGFVLLNWITLVNLPLGIYAVIALHGAVMAAIVFSLTYARLIRLDPSLEEAAHDLGASPNQTLRWVLLPALRLTFIGALLLVFMLSLEDLLGIFFLIGSGFNIQMLVWSRLRVQLTPELHAMATVIFVLSILVVVTYSFLLERDSKQSS